MLIIYRLATPEKFMKLKKMAKRFSLYGLVGISAGVIHTLVLLILLNFLPLWISNFSGFIAASLLSYIGHARYTFHQETKGDKFARRWLILQFLINTSLSILLPLILNQWSQLILTKVILVLTPTITNAMIWSKAAQFSLNRQPKGNTKPVLHADDLGLTKATNSAIIDLAKAGVLDSSSLIVNGSAVNEAVREWTKQDKILPALHLTLTEGKSIADDKQIRNLVDREGKFNCTFFKLLFSSVLPRKFPYRKKLEYEIRRELIAQIKMYKKLLKTKEIKLDGHQHIHLIPIVLDIIIEIKEQENINWIRTVSEPLPTKLTFQAWLTILCNKGFLKWIILQILNNIAKPRILKEGISTNVGFAGILFTGYMGEKNLLSAFKDLRLLSTKLNQTKPIILFHPATSLDNNEKNTLSDFPLSKQFISSKWRKKEWIAIKKVHKKINHYSDE
tara:strand:+ start:163 stop:1503 length:1341 start_codon:yes stop_codon:yes gene_type:complete